MGASVCQHCGQGVEVDDPRAPWNCPTCGRVNGMSRLEVASKLGCSAALFALAGLVLVVTFLAVFVHG